MAIKKRTKEERDELRNAALEEDDGEEGRAYFFIHNGKEELKIKALKDCWAIQKFTPSKDTKTGLISNDWSSFKYVTDLGSIANRIYEMRLKNSEVSTLEELSACSKKIASDIREEFRYKKERAK